MSNQLAYKTENNEGGYSLVETLVAISLLLVVISSIMLLVNQSIDSGRRLSDRLVASYLAADAIEYLRWDRDTHWLENSSNTFDGWIPTQCETATCTVDTRVGSGSINASSTDPLQYDPGSRRYGYDSSFEESKYTRTIRILQSNDLGNASGGDDEIRIKVRVSWPVAGGNTTDLVLRDTLTSWAD